MSYSSTHWEKIGEDAVRGDLYRLCVDGGWLVQSVGEGYSTMTFVPDGRMQWNPEEFGDPEEEEVEESAEEQETEEIEEEEEEIDDD